MFLFFYSLLEVLFVLLPVVLCVAFVTIIERKVLASMQRRVGPNQVGFYGLLQPFADALKLVLKEPVVTQHATKSLFYLAPVISLAASLLGWAVIPFGSGLSISDFSLGVLFSMAVSSIGIYGVFLAGWSSSNKYALLGSLRSTAQIISYELILSSAILVVVFVTGSFHYCTVIETQQSIWYVIPLFPVFVLFLISALAETGRTPFDLPEAESELVAGYFTEHGAAPFVFFFLAEYSSIVLMSCLTAIFFFGGYHMPMLMQNETYINIQSLVLAVKTLFFCFVIIWVRATLPRIRYTDLIKFMWSQLLPFACALIILVPSLLVAFNIIANPLYDISGFLVLFQVKMVRVTVPTLNTVKEKYNQFTILSSVRSVYLNCKNFILKILSKYLAIINQTFICKYTPNIPIFIRVKAICILFILLSILVYWMYLFFFNINKLNEINTILSFIFTLVGVCFLISTVNMLPAHFWGILSLAAFKNFFKNTLQITRKF